MLNKFILFVESFSVVPEAIINFVSHFVLSLGVLLLFKWLHCVYTIIKGNRLHFLINVFIMIKFYGGTFLFFFFLLLSLGLLYLLLGRDSSGWVVELFW